MICASNFNFMKVGSEMTLLRFTLNQVQTLTRSKCSYAFCASNEPLLSLTLPEVLEKSAKEAPDRVAIISQHQDITKTYHELAADVHRLASGLASLDIKKGDRVGIWSPNSYEWVLTQFATAMIGAVMVNVNPGYREKELSFCLNLVGCHTLISSQQFKRSKYFQILDSVSSALMKHRTGLGMESKELPTLKNLVFINQEEEPAPSNILRFNDLMSRSPREEVTPEVSFDDPVNIQFTSGTTGSPKGATLSHHNLVNNAYFSGKRILDGLTSTVIAAPVPLYHCFGSVVGSLMAFAHKATLVIPSPAPAPDETLAAIHNYKCDVVYGTPTMFVDILDSPNLKKYNTLSLERAVMSGSLCPVELRQRVRLAFPSCESIFVPYGTTETSPVLTLTQSSDSEKNAQTTVGRPLDHLEVKIADPSTGTATRVGEPGEVMARGYCTFIGYWDNREKTAEVMDTNRWYHTGDIGVMNEEGYISIVGRIKEMIIRGGENIYPREIEELLLTNDKVADVQVIGVTDPRMGEELCACIRLKQETEGTVSEFEIKDFCREKISHFKIPKHVLFFEDFPQTVTQKIQKFRLKEIAETRLGLNQASIN